MPRGTQATRAMDESAVLACAAKVEAETLEEGTSVAQDKKQGDRLNCWQKYRERHGQTTVRLPGFPSGRLGRVTLVRRNGHLVLRWRQDGRQHREAVRTPREEDLLPRAIERASEINREFVANGPTSSRLFACSTSTPAAGTAAAGAAKVTEAKHVLYSSDGADALPVCRSLGTGRDEEGRGSRAPPALRPRERRRGALLGLPCPTAKDDPLPTLSFPRTGAA